MDPKSESDPAPAVEADKPAAPEPVKLARLAMVRLTPEQLAARQKADEEERLTKLEAKKQATPPRGVSPVPSAPSHAAPPELEPLIAATVDTSPAVLSPAVSAPAPAASASLARIQFRLFDATLGFLGGEGKQIPSLCKLATRVAQRLGVTGADLERLPCAVQALYVASQLDHRGSFEPPDALAVRKLLGSSYEELAAVLAPCLRGALGKEPLERADATALAATVYFFNHTRTTSPTPQAAKTAVGTLKSKKWIPAAALDALAAEVA